jgi:hypothetical protein
MAMKDNPVCPHIPFPTEENSISPFKKLIFFDQADIALDVKVCVFAFEIFADKLEILVKDAVQVRLLLLRLRPLQLKARHLLVI